MTTMEKAARRIPTGVTRPKSTAERSQRIRKKRAVTPGRRKRTSRDMRSMYCTTPLKSPVTRPEKGPRITWRKSPARVTGTTTPPKASAANRAAAMSPLAPMEIMVFLIFPKERRTRRRERQERVVEIMPILRLFTTVSGISVIFWLSPSERVIRRL